MDKKKQMNFNVNNFLLALIDILDVKDCELNKVSKNHSLRVVYVSLKIGEKLDLEPKEMFDLCAYSLFHNYINERSMELLNICDEKNKLSNIVKFVHNIEELLHFEDEDIDNRIKIVEYLKHDVKNENYRNFFFSLSKNIDFWLDLQSSSSMIEYIYSTLYDFTYQPTFEEVLKITTYFGSLYEDVTQLLEKCKKMIDYYQFDEKDKLTFLISASMINFGKLTISDKILNKKDKLTFKEYEIVKSNVYYNKKALCKIYGFEDISKLASKHYEQLDSKGYPSGLNANSLSLKDRLMGTLNIYNSLLYDRAYRNKYSHTEAIQIMLNKAKNNEIDKSITCDIDKILG